MASYTVAQSHFHRYSMLGDETDFYCADKNTGPWYFNSTSFGTKGLELSASLVDLHERALAGDAAPFTDFSIPQYDRVAIGIRKVKTVWDVASKTTVLWCSCYGFWRIRICSHILFVFEVKGAAILGMNQPPTPAKNASGRPTQKKGKRDMQNSPQKQPGKPICFRTLMMCMCVVMCDCPCVHVRMRVRMRCILARNAKFVVSPSGLMVLSKPSPAAHAKTHNEAPASATVQEPISPPTNGNLRSAPAESQLRVQVSRVVGHASSTVSLRHHATEAMELVADEDEIPLGTNETAEI